MSDQEQGSHKRQSTSPVGQIWAFLISARTTIALLFLLAGASVLGTVVPQDVGLSRLEQAYSPFVFRLVVIMELDHVFRSWWFVALSGLLAANLSGCLVHRLPGILAAWKSDSRRSAFAWKTSDTRPPNEVKAVIAGAVSSVMGSAPVETSGKDGIRLVWIKHRIFLLGFPAIHISIIVVLVGALLGLLYGLKGHVVIREGQSGSEVRLTPSGRVWKLPFEIAVDRFVLKRYPSGEPQEYRSDVRLIEDGREVLKTDIRVNHPVTYRRISLYQSDYDVTGVKGVKLAMKSPDGKNQEFVVQPGQASQVPGTGVRLQLLRLEPGSSGTSPSLMVGIESSGTKPQETRLYMGAAAGVKVGDSELTFLDYEPEYATGLQVTYDPGNKVVYAGFCLLIVGFSLTLFTNHRRVAVEIARSDGKTRVQVFGLSRRTQKEFRPQIEEVIRTALRGSEER
ncbi:MAG: cytochrome c biogenesis protein ResB [Thermodesulfobacteriota bacterium]